MIWKKNKFGYVLWFIYTIITGVSLGTLLAAACMEAGHPLWVGVLGCVVFMSIEAFLAWSFYHKIADKVTFGKKGYNKSKGRIFECGMVLILLAVSAAIPAAGIFSAPEASIYFNLAKIVDNGAVPRVLHGITYLYIGLLHFVFFFFGNMIEAGYWLQIGLVVFAFLMLYLAVRKLSGRIPAFIMLLFAVFAPSFRIDVLVLSPRPLSLFLYGAGFLVVALCVKAKKQTFGKCLFAGIVAGLLTYLDIMGATLLFFAVGIFLVKSSDSLKKRGVLFLLSLLGALIGFGGALFTDAFFSGKQALRILSAMGGLYMPSMPDAAVFAFIESVPYDIIFLLCLMAFGIFSYWCNHWSDELAIWVVAALGTIALVVFQVPARDVPGLFWCYLFMAATAGVAVSNLFKIRQVAKNEEEYFIHTEGSNVVGEAGIQKPGAASEENSGGTAMGQEEKQEENREGGTVTVEFEGQTREVKLLENPLPLPKKKAHKAMDFDYEVKEDDDYDI